MRAVLFAAGMVLGLLATECRAFAKDPYGPRVPRAATTRTCKVPPIAAGTVTLPNDCVYDSAIIVETSGVTLDCNGAQLSDGKGILVRGDIEDVRVENCWLDGTSGMSVSPPARLPDESEDAWRQRSPKRVVISHVSVLRAKGSGVFIGPAVDGVVLEGSIIEGSESAGVYLEHGTEHAKIRGNLIRANGHRSKGFDRTEWTRREGVAVDASAMNEIEDNRFEANGFGGVFLYKNCHEHSTTDTKSPPRPLHAHSNVIRRNVFVDMPIGVWIASRQARDLGAWDCGDASPYAPQNPIPLAEAFPPGYPMFRSTIPARYDLNLEYPGAALLGRVCEGTCSATRDAIWAWEDFAEDTLVEQNRFESLGLAGVRVEDDRARIVGNTFVGDFDWVYVGTPLRSRFLAHPVRDTVLRDNLFTPPDSRLSFEDHLALVPGEHEGTLLEGNRCLEPCSPAPGGAAPGAPSGEKADASGGGCAQGGVHGSPSTAFLGLAFALARGLLRWREGTSGRARSRSRHADSARRRDDRRATTTRR